MAEPAKPTTTPTVTPPATPAAKPAETVAFVEVGKDGERLQVHPTTVAAHVAAGWRVVKPEA